MTVSPASPPAHLPPGMPARPFRAALLATVVAGLALATPPGLAQQQQPVSPPPPSGPLRLLPASPGGPAGQPADGTPAPPARAPSGVQVEQLPTLSADAGGTIDPTNGGLPPDLWRGTPRDLAERLILALPAELASGALRQTVRRVLLSRAAPPLATANDTGETGPAPRGLAALRLEALSRMGDADATRAFAESVTIALEDAAAAAAWAEVQLLAGEAAEVCKTLSVLAGRFPDPAFEMYGIVCRALEGDPAGITIGIDILREKGVGEDLFFRLAEAAAAGTKQAVRGVNDPTPVQLALIRASGRGLPAEVKVTGAAASAALARSAETPLAPRLAAAERAAALGSLPGRDLLTVYRSVKVTPAELAAARGGATGNRNGAEARALLIQALTGESAPAVKGEVLPAAVAAADVAMLSGGYGDLLAQEVGILPATQAFAFAAPAAVRVLLLQGRPDLARPWVEIARTEAMADGSLAAGGGGAYGRIWPLAVLFGLARAEDVELGAWLEAQNVADDADARRRAGSVLALLTAAGVQLDPAQRLRLLDPGAAAGPAGPVPDATLWYRLEDAGAGRRLGEAALLAVLLLGERGAAGAPALPAAHAVLHLATAGLAEEARRVAAEDVAALLAP